MNQRLAFIILSAFMVGVAAGMLACLLILTSRA